MAKSLKVPVAKNISQYGKVTVFVTSSLRRTIKFMATASRTSIFVTFEWLEQSHKSRQILSCDDFLLVDDPVLAAQYGISHGCMLENGKRARESGGLLANTAVYVGPGVVGQENDAPEMAHIKHLVKLVGGNVASTQGQALTIGSGTLLVITKDGVLPSKLEAAEGAKQITLGLLMKVFHHQSLDSIEPAEPTSSESNSTSKDHAAPDSTPAKRYKSQERAELCKKFLPKLDLKLPSERDQVKVQQANFAPTLKNVARQGAPSHSSVACQTDKAEPNLERAKLAPLKDHGKHTTNVSLL